MGSVLTAATYSTTSLGQGHVRVVGHEVVGDVTSAGVGTNLAGVYDSNPACWINSRLSLLARTYERYRYNSCTIEYQTAVATSTGGSVVVAVETDPDEILPSGSGATQRALNSQFAALSPVWQMSRVTYRRNPKDHKWFLASQVGETSRAETTQFLAYSLIGGAIGAGELAGRIIFRYDIEFIYPELELLPSGAQYARQTATDLISGGAAGSPVIYKPPASTLIGGKIGEIRLNVSLPSAYVKAAGDWFDLLAGAAAFIAWNGSDWLMYPTYAAAVVGAEPLKWTGTTVAQSAVALVRILIDNLNAR